MDGSELGGKTERDEMSETRRFSGLPFGRVDAGDRRPAGICQRENRRASGKRVRDEKVDGQTSRSR